jgi:xanthine dehydrogenase molybdopterin-binding subunit B
VWDKLKASCNFVEARKSVNNFNCNNRWRKRGIAMVPTKFGIAFTAKFMNQVTHHETSGNLSIVIGVCGSTEFFVFFMSDVRKSLKDVI